MNTMAKRITGWLTGVMVLMTALPTLSPGETVWWNDQWQYRQKISFDTTAGGADVKESLSNMPVLIRLHSGNFNFANAKEDGGDIRFVSADNTQLLKHHIEKFDFLDEIGLAWVKVPQIAANGSQDFVWMYYGNPDAVGGQDAGGTYDMGQALVYHLGELEGPPRDAGPHAHHAASFSGGQGLPAAIGNGIALNGAGDRIVVEPTPALDFAGGFSICAWVKINDAQSDAWLISRKDEQGAFLVGIDGTQVHAAIYNAEGPVAATDKSVNLTIGSWHRLVVTCTPGERLAIYLDGLEMTWVNLGSDLPVFNGEIVIGEDLTGGHAFFGEIDEIVIYTRVLTPGWIRASYAAQGPESLLYGVGVEEMGGGGGGLPVFYLAAIARNVTLDGMVIIGLLMLLSLASWIVFFIKTGNLWIAGKHNRKFMRSYQQTSDPMHIDEGDADWQFSNLFRLYRTGRAALEDQAQPNVEDHETEGSHRPEAMLKTMRTALEKGFIYESKRLNSKLTILTMAISGGPFLGLLGTVWGVMNTFAAMAEAGEANIMAIAPGVASALATTVFGLIVAIPALFAYNFLTSRIKNITAEVGVFIDEFALRIENTMEKGR